MVVWTHEMGLDSQISGKVKRGMLIVCITLQHQNVIILAWPIWSGLSLKKPSHPIYQLISVYVSIMYWTSGVLDQQIHQSDHFYTSWITEIIWGVPTIYNYICRYTHFLSSTPTHIKLILFWDNMVLHSKFLKTIICPSNIPNN